MSGRGTYRGHIAGALALACALSAASCAGDGDSATTAPAAADTAEPDSVDSSPVTTPDTAPETTTTAAGDAALTAPTEPADATIAVPSSEGLAAAAVATADQVNDYLAAAAAFELAGADILFPQGLPVAAGGAPGYSRYVFRENSAGVVPTLVEGPIDDAVRCQDEALPCSYLELKALDDAVRSSAATVPPELRMTPD
jgi:hypothetical protein